MLRFQAITMISAAALLACACGHGNGPARNEVPAADAAAVDVTSAKGLWVIADDIREFRKTGRTDGLCRRMPHANVRDLTCVIDANGGVFYYTQRSWNAATDKLQLGELDRSGHISFRDIPAWHIDKSLKVEAIVDGDVMTWRFKRADDNQQASSAVFARSSADEIRKFDQALGNCADGGQNAPRDRNGN